MLLQERIDEIGKQREEEKKKVDAIMEQVMELNRNCNRPVDPNIVRNCNIKNDIKKIKNIIKIILGNNDMIILNKYILNN